MEGLVILPVVTSRERLRSLWPDLCTKSQWWNRHTEHKITIWMKYLYIPASYSVLQTHLILVRMDNFWDNFEKPACSCILMCNQIKVQHRFRLMSSKQFEIKLHWILHIKGGWHCVTKGFQIKSPHPCWCISLIPVVISLLWFAVTLT